MLGKSRIAVFCSMIRGSGCSKSRLPKAAGAEVAACAGVENDEFYSLFIQSFSGDGGL